MLPNSAVTVAYGQMFVATHIDILAKILSDEKVRGKLSESADYLRVSGDLATIALSEQSPDVYTNGRRVSWRVRITAHRQDAGS